MTDTDKDVLYGGNIEIEIQGKRFTIKPLTLQHIITGEFKESGLFFPHDKDNIGQLQYYNVADPEKREQVDKWMQRTLFYEGKSVTFEQVCEWGWDLTDLGRWIDLVVRVSG